MRRCVRVRDGRNAVGIDRSDELRLVPIGGGLFVAAPERFWIFAEQVGQQLKFFRLCLVQVFVDGAFHLRGLLDQGDCGADRSVLFAFANLCFCGTADALG